MDADPGTLRERYRNARAMEYGSLALGVPASYLAAVGEWGATLTALALGVAVYALGYLERVVAARESPVPSDDR